MKDLKFFKSDLNKIADELLSYLDNKAPHDAGTILERGFKRSFNLQRFNDYTGTGWQEVKRRQSGSGWYGHGSKTGAAKTRAILINSGALRDSIRYEASRGMVKVMSSEIYAPVHNEGLNAKIYGKKTFKMPKRKFMGHSELILSEIRKKVDTNIKRIITS